MGAKMMNTIPQTRQMPCLMIGTQRNRYTTTLITASPIKSTTGKR